MSEPRNFFAEWKKKKAEEEAAEQGPLEPTLPDPHAPLAEKPEAFQWNEERERAIQEFLETTSPGTLPSVHLQLQAIRHAVIKNEIPRQRAQALINEVNGYLLGHIRQEEAKPRIEHEGMCQARDDKLRALYAWRECSDALEKYLAKNEEVYLEVSAYAGDQGSAFLAAARRHILESEPEPPEEDEE